VEEEEGVSAAERDEMNWRAIGSEDLGVCNAVMLLLRIEWKAVFAVLPVTRWAIYRISAYTSQTDASSKQSITIVDFIY